MELPYDGDTNDPSQYCRHGSFIGSWWGPDILCGYCEMGEEPEDEPEVVQCDHVDIGQDMDGSVNAFPCATEAGYTLDVDAEGRGVVRWLLCQKHLVAWFAADGLCERDGEVWFDNEHRLIKLHLKALR